MTEENDMIVVEKDGSPGKKPGGRINFQKLGARLLLAFLAVGLLPFAIVAIVSLNQSSSALEKQAFNQLESVREIKKGQIERFFEERRGDMAVLVDTVKSLRQEAYAKLDSNRELKRSAIERYFGSIRDQVITFSSSYMVVDAMRAFKKEFKLFGEQNQYSDADVEMMKAKLKTFYTGEFGAKYTDDNGGKAADIDGIMAKLDNEAIIFQYNYIKANSNPLGSKHLLDRSGDSSDYSGTHEYVHPIIRQYLEKFGYYDIFMVDIETGDIVYSVFKELDYATSLLDGPYAGTNFAAAFKKAKEATDKDFVALEDYIPYTPSYEAPASFIASPIFDGDEKIGVLVFQMPVERIDAIVNNRTGLGETGEAYLVGRLDGKTYLRSNRTVKKAGIGKPKSGKNIDMALAGKSGRRIKVGSSGDIEITTYAPLNIPGLEWMINVTMSLEEVIAPVLEGETKDFFTKYINHYGYYDLFLINTNGYVFYTVTKEADYQTNMVSGKYKDSNLGELVRETLKTGKYGFADFKPYAPSNMEPAAFIAEPVTVNGKTDMVVALQLSLKAINAIMQERAGMGETGETYLIGSDKLMRSDSFLDQVNHTVVASFANPSKGSVDTEGAREAISGKTDSKIITDYNGNPVLSSYTPVQVGGASWGLLAEVDEAEAFAAINTIEWEMIIIAIIGVILIGITAVMIARSITRPVEATVTAIKEIAAGDFTQQIEVKSNDEIGELGNAVNGMVVELREMFISISENSRTLAASAEELSSVSTQLAGGSEEMSSQASTVASATEQMSSNINSMASAVEEGSVNAATVSSTAEEMSTNMNTISSAIEEMTVSISDVSKNSQDTATIASQANELASGATTTMKALGASANEIGKVTEMIKRIAEQTNLLALNATIEAASAGDAGKGFAVVANEIKELANQSAQAAEEIANKISGVQTSTTSAVKVITDVSDIIGQINEAVDVISHSVNQQTKAANEIASTVAEASNGSNNIASSIAEVAKGTSDMSRNAGEAAKGANEVSSNIQGINKAVTENNAGIQQINNSTNDLARIAGELESMMDKFKVESNGGPAMVKELGAGK